MSKHVREMCGKLYFQYSKFQKGHNSHKNLRKSATFELDLKYSKTKSYEKFQLNMSKHVRGNVRKTKYFQYSKFQKGHNSYKKLMQIDDTQTWSVVQ